VSPFVVSFRSVVCLIDRFPVLAGVDFAVGRGEIVLLSGANGAGKTSLLRAIAGLLSIAQGDAEVLGYDISANQRAVRRQLGFLGHQSFLYGELTAAENIAFAVAASGASRSAIAPALDRLGLSGRLADVTVDRLSAGQRRRTALAILVARDPELWLLDEPHTGLDADARTLLDEIVEDAAARGRTVLFSSHETDRVAAIATRHEIVDGGVIVPRTIALDGNKVGVHVS
jgi:heme ABC exporter ATP-binding subunit CcmA